MAREERRFPVSTGTLSPVGQQQFFTDAGVVLNGGVLYFYLSGTSTPTPVYSDAALLVPYGTSVTLNSAGRVPGGLYLNPSVGAYKLIVKDSSGVTVGNTIDPLTATNAGTSGLGEIYVFGGNPSSPVTATSYPSGATFDKLQPGTAVFHQDSGSLASGTYVIEAMGVVSAGATLTVAIVDLDDGAPDTPLATLTITSTTGARAQSGAITFAAAGTAKNYGIKTKVDTGTGFAWGSRLMRTA